MVPALGALSVPELITNVPLRLRPRLAATLMAPLLVRLEKTVVEELMLMVPVLVMEPEKLRPPSPVGPGLTVTVPLLVKDPETPTVLLEPALLRMSVPLLIHGLGPELKRVAVVGKVLLGWTMTVIPPGMLPVRLAV